jgi:hypothetical protein
MSRSFRFRLRLALLSWSKACWLVSLPLAITITVATPISRLVSKALVRWCTVHGIPSL